MSVHSLVNALYPTNGLMMYAWSTFVKGGLLFATKTGQGFQLWQPKVTEWSICGFQLHSRSSFLRERTDSKYKACRKTNMMSCF